MYATAESFLRWTWATSYEVDCKERPHVSLLIHQLTDSLWDRVCAAGGGGVAERSGVITWWCCMELCPRDNQHSSSWNWWHRVTSKTTCVDIVPVKRSGSLFTNCLSLATAAVPLCASLGPCGHGQSPLPYSLTSPFLHSVSIFYFSLSLVYSLHLFFCFSICSCSTRILPLRFQAGCRRRRLNLALFFCFDFMFYVEDKSRLRWSSFHNDTYSIYIGSLHWVTQR